MWRPGVATFSIPQAFSLFCSGTGFPKATQPGREKGLTGGAYFLIVEEHCFLFKLGGSRFPCRGFSSGPGLSGVPGNLFRDLSIQTQKERDGV